MKKKTIIKRLKFNWLRIKLYFKRKKGPLHAYGTHIISGYMGSGKTLLMSHIINTVDKEKYFFYSNQQQFNQENITYFDIEKLFNGGEQIAKLPLKDERGRICYGVIFDEINFNFNRRLNRNKNYNELFIPLINFIVSSRHQGINRVYFIGQKLELQDTQLQSLFLWNHDIIYTRKKYSFPHFLNTEKMELLPKKLILLNRIKADNDTFVVKSKQRIKFTYNDFNYDTFALRKVFNNLPNIN